MCLALLAMVLRRQILNRFTLNQNDWQPDAWARPAHEHRAYVMSKRERSSSCCGHHRMSQLAAAAPDQP